MGRPVVHWEFWSENPENISDFYKKVFDWNVRHIPEMNYRMVETGGEWREERSWWTKWMFRGSANSRCSRTLTAGFSECGSN